MRKPSVKFWLLTLTLNQILRLAILKTVGRGGRRRRGSTTTTIEASLSRN